MLISFNSFAFEKETLPVEKNEIKKEDTNTLQKENLTPVEQSNIVEIYNKKIEYPQFEMGLRYYNGSNGLIQNFDKAIFWFSNSSRDEYNPNADMMLASMYYEGKGFEKDKKKSLSFYTRAGNRNNLTAQLILTGIYFFNSEFMNQEYANYWIYKAIGNGSKEAEVLKTLILVKEEDYKTINKFISIYEKNEKDETSNFILGYLYFTGKVVEQNFNKSHKYLKNSALNGNPISLIMLEEVENFENNK
jgi:TPR repeat protein